MVEGHDTHAHFAVPSGQVGVMIKVLRLWPEHPIEEDAEQHAVPADAPSEIVQDFRHGALGLASTYPATATPAERSRSSVGAKAASGHRTRSAVRVKKNKPGCVPRARMSTSHPNGSMAGWKKAGTV